MVQFPLSLSGLVTAKGRCYMHVCDYCWGKGLRSVRSPHLAMSGVSAIRMIFLVTVTPLKCQPSFVLAHSTSKRGSSFFNIHIYYIRHIIYIQVFTWWLSVLLLIWTVTLKTNFRDNVWFGTQKIACLVLTLLVLGCLYLENHLMLGSLLVGWVKQLGYLKLCVQSYHSSASQMYTG